MEGAYLWRIPDKKRKRGLEMRLRRIVLVLLVFCLVSVGTAIADPECFPGIGFYDINGNWNCAYGSGGNCLICFDEIIVRG
jgi:hypothetical protein